MGTTEKNEKNRLSALGSRAAKIIRLYSGLPKPLYTLLIVTVVNSIGMFVFPFMTLYLTSKQNMTQTQTGTYLLIISLIYIPGNFIGGKLADRWGRKRLMVATQVISAALFIPCGFAAFAPYVPFLIIASVFFDGITDPARSAMMTDLTTPDNRRTAFSLSYLGHNVGFAIGSLIAGFLFEHATSWLFWGNAAAALAGISIMAMKVPETKPTQEQINATIGSGSTEEAHSGTLVQALLSRPFLLAFTAITTWYGFVYAQHRFALPLQTKAFFGQSGAAIYGTLMTLNAVLVILLSTPVLAWTKRWKPINAVALAGAFYAVGFGMVGISKNVVLIYLSTAIWTLGEIVNATNEGAYVSNHTPISHRGRFNAILPLIGSLGWTISPPLLGNLMDRRSLGAVWPVLGIVAAASALALYVLGRIEDRMKAKGGETGTAEDAVTAALAARDDQKA
ncbi:MAG TPA: MFS transporter [Rectinemataceae bacterium]